MEYNIINYAYIIEFLIEKARRDVLLYNEKTKI